MKWTCTIFMLYMIESRCLTYIIYALLVMVCILCTGGVGRVTQAVCGKTLHAISVVYMFICNGKGSLLFTFS